MFRKRRAARGRAGRGAVASVVCGCGPLVAVAVLALVLAPGAGAAPIPYVPTVLPTYIGHAVGAQPVSPPGAPQNPFMAPNPFGQVHLDPWQSDTSSLAGPLGRAPTSWSSRLAQARRPGSGRTWQRPMTGGESLKGDSSPVIGRSQISVPRGPFGSLGGK